MTRLICQAFGHLKERSLSFSGMQSMRAHVGVDLLPSACPLRARPSRQPRARPFTTAAAKHAPQQGHESRTKRGGFAELGSIGLTFGGDAKQVCLQQNWL